MKVFSLQGLLATMLVSIAAAHTNHAQLLDKKVTLKLKDAPLESALKALEVQADLKFFYSLEHINLEAKISIEAIEQPLSDLLRKLFDPLNISFKVHEKSRAITLRQRHREKTQPKLGEYENTVIEEIDWTVPISGTVNDASTNEPMPGVNVLVKGSTRGTSTDANGKYVIDVDEGDVLVFSFIGFKSVELQAGHSTVLDVIMSADAKTLEAVEINAGYWMVTPEERTGNIGRVTAVEISRQPVSNPIASLQGRIPGLEVIQQTGMPGGNFTVRIRGQNSIANGNDPLFVIDGVPFQSTTLALPRTAVELYGSAGTSPLNNINPSDIESIEVLKDADATSIYGSRGANGVILITTKKGKSGKTKVDARLTSGIGTVASKMDLLTTPQYLEMRNEAFKNDAIVPDAGNAPDMILWDTTRYTDWQKELIGGTSSYTDAQLAVSGGNDNTQFVAGGAYHRETTVFPGENSDQRVSTHISLTNRSKDNKFKMVVSANYAESATSLPGIDLTPQALTLPPSAPELFENGELNWTNWTFGMPNPLSYTLQEYSAHTRYLLGNGVLSYFILPGMEIKASLGHTISRMDASRSIPLTALHPSVRAGNTNNAAFSSNENRSWIIEPQMNWTKAINQHSFTALLGTTFLNQTNEGETLLGEGYTSEALMKDIGSAGIIKNGGSNYAQYRYHAVFGRINYALKERYVFNFTARRDGSSRFGPDNKYANFGAVGGAWAFSKEPFFDRVQGFISFGKLRASYGTSGNDQIGDYQYLDTYTNSGSYQGANGLRPVRLSNPDYAWEINHKLEGALELYFIDNRIQVEMSCYRNVSSNQLIGNPLPPTTGFGSIQSNLPATVKNSGVEIAVSSINIDQQHFGWSSSFNITIPRNELVEFPGLDRYPEYANILRVGEPLKIRNLYHHLGVDQLTGLYQFEDFDNNGVFNSADRQSIIFVGQKYYGGLDNSIRYKDIQLDIFFQFVSQNGYNYINYSSSLAPGSAYNYDNVVVSRWRQEGDIAQIQKFSTSATAQGQYNLLRASDQVVGNASFLRIKNISLSYSFPKRLMEKTKVDNLRFYLQGQNVLTITDYEGLDPENQTSMLPPLRIFSAGFQVTL